MQLVSCSHSVFPNENCYADHASSLGMHCVVFSVQAAWFKLSNWLVALSAVCFETLLLLFVLSISA